MQFAPFHRQIDFTATLIAGNGFEFETESLFQNFRDEKTRRPRARAAAAGRFGGAANIAA